MELKLKQQKLHCNSAKEQQQPEGGIKSGKYENTSDTPKSSEKASTDQKQVLGQGLRKRFEDKENRVRIESKCPTTGVRVWAQNLRCLQWLSCVCVAMCVWLKVIFKFRFINIYWFLHIWIQAGFFCFGLVFILDIIFSSFTANADSYILFSFFQKKNLKGLIFQLLIILDKCQAATCLSMNVWKTKNSRFQGQVGNSCWAERVL